MQHCGNGLKSCLALYQMTIFQTGPNSKHFADDKLNIAKLIISVFDQVENIVGKEENAGYQHFPLFPCFHKASFLGSLKVSIVW